MDEIYYYNLLANPKLEWELAKNLANPEHEWELVKNLLSLSVTWLDFTFIPRD